MSTVTAETPEQNICARCGAEVETGEKRDHAEQEHDNQPTQYLSALATSEVIETTVAEIEDFIENYGEFGPSDKKGRIIVIRELLDNYERVKDLADETTDADTDKAIETAIEKMDAFIDSYVSILDIEPSERDEHKKKRKDRLKEIREVLSEQVSSDTGEA